MQILIVFSQSHGNFRVAELSSLCEVFGIKVDLAKVDSKSTSVVLDFSSLDDVRKILSRSVLIKFAVKIFYTGDRLQTLEMLIKADRLSLIEPFNTSESSYALRFFSIGKKKKIDVCQRLSNLANFVGLDDAVVNLTTPQNEFYLVEEYDLPTDETPSKEYFGVLVGEGQKYLKTKYNLKSRVYIGNTTMDPELSFIQSNIAQVIAGDIVLDPFVGTGGLLLPAAHFGAYVLGTEINYQTARALGKPSRQGVTERTEQESIMTNFVQQNTQDKLLGIMIADSSKQGIWNSQTRFDVIIADPPYGVREKALKVGTHETAHDHHVSLPKKEEYDLNDTYLDLLNLAANFLTVGGRVSFWYPVVLEDYFESNLPSHPVMQILHNCEQQLTRKTGRRLLTYRKIREAEQHEATSMANQNVEYYRKLLLGL